MLACQYSRRRWWLPRDLCRGVAEAGPSAILGHQRTLQGHDLAHMFACKIMSSARSAPAASQAGCHTWIDLGFRDKTGKQDSPQPEVPWHNLDNLYAWHVPGLVCLVCLESSQSAAAPCKAQLSDFQQQTHCMHASSTCKPAAAALPSTISRLSGCEPHL